MALPLEKESEVSLGGYQGIKKLRGLLVGLNVVPQPSGWEGRGNVVQVDLEDVTILEMSGGEDPFELKDGKFRFVIPYKLTAGGKIAPGTLYDKCWRASAKELGKLPSEFIGQYVTLEKQPRVLFPKLVLDPETKKVLIGEDGKKVVENILAVDSAGRPKCFCFVGDETVDSESTKNYIKGKVLGLNTKAALRALLGDTRARQFPEFKDKLKAGTLAEELGLVLVDDKFVEKT